jgi:uncharacterized protein
MISSIKNGIHVVAIDDTPHNRNDKTTELIFCYCKSTFIEKVSKSIIIVDGIDATELILKELTPHQESFTLILLHGITVGGLNMVNIEKISKILHKPLLAVTENPPTADSLNSAIKNLPDYEYRKNCIKKAGELHLYSTSNGPTPLYYHLKNISKTIAEQFFSKFCIRSRLPEQLLLAHKIASAWK